MSYTQQRTVVAFSRRLPFGHIVVVRPIKHQRQRKDSQNSLPITCVLTVRLLPGTFTRDERKN